MSNARIGMRFLEHGLFECRAMVGIPWVEGCGGLVDVVLEVPSLLLVEVET